MKKILVALDLESETDALLEHASALAKAFNGELILVNVEPNLPGSEGETKVQAEQDIRSELSEEVHQLHHISNTLSGKNIANRALLLEGTPAEQVLSVAKDLQVDMIVIGSHAHNPIYSTLFGGIARNIIKHAGRPVLLVPLI